MEEAARNQSDRNASDNSMRYLTTDRNAELPPVDMDASERRSDKREKEKKHRRRSLTSLDHLAHLPPVRQNTSKIWPEHQRGAKEGLRRFRC